MRISLQRDEVLNQVSIRADQIAHVRFVLVEPVVESIHVIESFERVQTRISHDADAGRSRRQADQPGPVATIHQMRRRILPKACEHTSAKFRIVGKLFDVDRQLDSQPGGIGLVL